MTYLIKYVFQIKQDLNQSVFKMITGINEPKTLAKHIYLVNVNVNLIEQIVIQTMVQ